MANVLVNDASLADIADAIREKNGTEETYKPAEMGEAVRAIESGDSYYDTFWDAFQKYGNRTDFCSAFSAGNAEGASVWNDEILKPKYDMYVTNAQAMFAHNQSITDLSSLGVILDFSKVKGDAGFTFTFQNCANLKKLPVIDLSSQLVQLHSTFIKCEALQELNIRNLAESVKFTRPFDNCNALETLSITGTIGNSVSFAQSSLLSSESVQNIIDCLKDLTGGTAQTLTLHTDVKAKLTETQIATITGKNWTLA